MAYGYLLNNFKTFFVTCYFFFPQLSKGGHELPPTMKCGAEHYSDATSVLEAEARDSSSLLWLPSKFGASLSYLRVK